MAVSQQAGMRILFLACLFLITRAASQHKTELFITYDDADDVPHGFGLHLKQPKGISTISSGTFRDATNQTGWTVLEVWTNGSFPDKLQAYAAGLVEGTLTQELITLSWHNTMKGYCDAEPITDYCKRLRTFIKKNADWMQTQIDQHAQTDPYWHQVELFYAQLNGLRDGFRKQIKSPKQPLVVDPLDMFVLMQLSGDVEDLESALKSSHSRVLGSGSCSALIKLLPGNADLLTSQDTWNSFSSMLRILKKYDFNFRPMASATAGTRIPGHAMTFSSYPGSLTSGDDFYVISSGLITLETTIGNSNASLWKFVKPSESVFESVRSMVANRVTQSGNDWTKMFSTYNSGTYNNQWMVVDYKKFTPGEDKLHSELLYVLEQIPGHIVSGSVTNILQRQSYWPSYNVPYFPEIFRMSGNEVMVEKYGPWFTYNHTARANIFRRDHVTVKDVPSMIKLMRYNDFTHDPLSKCNCTPPYSAENAISARSDLNPASGTYPFSALGHRNHGGTDMKLTSSSLAKNLDFIAVAGPTYDNVPAFQWSKADFGKTDPHLGHPDLWKFTPIQTTWLPTPRYNTLPHDKHNIN